jgi:geranylgeranyl diphosphate synthase type II
LGLQGPALDPLPAACAVEMVHVYSLVHDDLPAMDDDDLRRGQPTCHRKFGEAMAILVGDALLTQSFEILGKAYPGSIGGEACLELALAAGGRGMVGGQVVDLAAEGKLLNEAAPQGLEDLESLHRRKTGELIRVALRLGCLVGAPLESRPSLVEWMDQLDQFGRDVGLAFQITDDLLDVEGVEGKAGKRVGKDAAKGKLTYPGLLGVEASRERAAMIISRARTAIETWGKHGEELGQLAEILLARQT